MTHETNRPADHPDAEEVDPVEAAVLDPAKTERASTGPDAPANESSERHPAEELDPDAPGLSALGMQDGPPVEPNEPA